MKPRSPVLGYNHNVRYVARMWHVQTEDSGVQMPHIYTHLFHDGTILASKKTDYDPASEVVVVQKLMQTQHKTMLRDLKSGTFDQKIEKYFGPIVREAGESVEPAEAAVEAQLEPATDPEAQPTRAAASQDSLATVPDLGPLLPPPAAHAPMPPPRAEPPRAEPPRARATMAPARPSIAVPARGSGTNVPPPPTIGGRSSSPAPTLRSAPPTIGSGRSGASTSSSKISTEGVLVGRPSVIVGKDAGQSRGAADFWKTEPRAAAAPEPAFGGDLISEKSLDEVILAYLSEDAPKK